MRDHVGALIAMGGRVVQWAFDVLFAKVSAIFFELKGYLIKCEYAFGAGVRQSDNGAMIEQGGRCVTPVKSIIEEILSRSMHSMIQFRYSQCSQDLVVYGLNCWAADV